MNIGDTLRKNASWLIGGSVTTRFLQFGVGIVLARLLVPEDFGLLVTIQVFTGFVGFFASAGMGQALVQAKEAVERDYCVVFTLQFLICCSIYFGFYHIAPYFAVWFDDPRYVDFLRVSALSFLLRPFLAIPQAKLKRDQHFDVIVRLRVATMILESLLSIYLAWLGFATWALILGGLFGSVVLVVFLYIKVRWIPRIAFEKTSAKRLGSYGIKMSANDLINYFRNHTANLMTSRILGPAAVGLFNKANSLQSTPSAITAGSVYQSIFRALSAEQDNVDLSRYIYLKTVTLVTCYTLPIYVGVAYCAEPLIVGLYGEKWAPSAAPMQILCIVGALTTITKPAGAVIAARNLIPKEIVAQLVAWLMLIVGVWIGSNYGLTGIAYGVIASYCLLTVQLNRIALTALDLDRKRLGGAILPAAVLSVIVAITLVIVDLVLPPSLVQQAPLVYLVAMGAAGALSFLLGFVLVPIEVLRNEVERWKKKLTGLLGRAATSA